MDKIVLYLLFLWHQFLKTLSKIVHNPLNEHIHIPLDFAQELRLPQQPHQLHHQVVYSEGPLTHHFQVEQMRMLHI